jgi:guanylate kinase
MSSSDPAPRPAKRGKLIVVSGPSGAGKTSICEALLEQLPDTVWSVSVTTRPPRGGEQSGRSYEFVSPEEFERREAAGEFLESATYVGHRYGTMRSMVEEALSRGQTAITEIDVQGGLQVAKKMPDSVRIFVLPPDPKALRARLEGRETEAEEQLVKRLAEADGEIAVARDSGCYQHFVINDVLKTTIERVKRIVQAETGDS